MGPQSESKRPYPVYEDPRVARDFRIPNKGHHVANEIVSQQDEPLRDFRGYCEMRLREANGQPCGVKIGATAWLGDPDPASLPIRIVRVLRPLEDSIRSNWRYGQEAGQAKIRRAMEVAGYWACCEALCTHVAPVVTLDFYALLREPGTMIAQLVTLLDLEPSQEQIRAAKASVEPSMRHV